MSMGNFDPEMSHLPLLISRIKLSNEKQIRKQTSVFKNHFSNVRKKGWACIFLMKTTGLSYWKNDPQEMKKHPGNKHWLKC